MQNQGYETVPFLLQSRQILSVQINFYTGSGLSLLLWKTALDYTGLDREPILYIFSHRGQKKYYLNKKRVMTKNIFYSILYFLTIFFRYYPIAARFSGIPQIWCIQKANCGEIFSLVEFYFWWNFWCIQEVAKFCQFFAIKIQFLPLIVKFIITQCQNQSFIQQ